MKLSLSPIRSYREFKAGLYSGYPLCCNIFYSIFLTRFISKMKYVKWEMKKARNYGVKNDYNSHHILCPLCVYTFNFNVGRIDEDRGDCYRTSLFSALKKYIDWKRRSYEEKIEHNMKIVER